MSGENEDTSHLDTVQTRVYVQRWYILAVFSILGVLQASSFVTIVLDYERQ